MQFKTLAELRTKINQDIDLEDERFIVTSEMTGYINEAIRVCESLIHTIYEDYFLSSYAIPLVTGTITYDLPTDIFADKIRAVMYANNGIIYPIKKVRGYRKFEKITSGYQYATFDDYRYYLTNVAGVGIKLNLIPAARETSSTVATIDYLRHANRLVNETDLCDIPEFEQYVIQYVKVRAYEKDVGNPNLAKAIADLEFHRAMMVETLTTMIPDDDDTLEVDMSSYEDMS